MNHDIWEKEIHTYTNQNELESTFTYTGDDTPRELRIFGDNEPWSQAFRDYVFKKNTSQSFHGQTTQFLFSVDGTLTTIKLINPMGFPYGEIKFFYDYLGFVKEETWQSLPSGNVIRRFVYEMDIQNESKKLWEYGKKGEEISYIELQMGDDDKLYPNPIPRTGNILDEVDIVLNEIIRTGIHPPIPAHIPQMETDQVLLKNGDLLDVKIISIHDNHVSFKMENDTLNYSIQLNKVVQVKDRWGHILFPKYP